MGKSGEPEAKEAESESPAAAGGVAGGAGKHAWPIGAKVQVLLEDGGWHRGVITAGKSTRGKHEVQFEDVRNPL
jgi:hypothetical protein